MYNERQIILQSPLYLYFQSLSLLIHEGLIPIQIHANFTYSHKITPSIQKMFQNIQLVSKITRNRSGMKSYHRITNTSIFIANI